ncbi:hypothetical protein NSK_007153 [Nannochloropsis salina CCMP1776]|uniref:Uncharacterized protein n=1 Tax=Nannochloropsis salina CCMP1776 TaxID=1027361 RepID=A0A4D9CQR5_9STRA|nr:hypothetical protein NSK_007153 [Nannochloropsis salina CCMP1776]|eukprot:TFJ81512.1 hypothetical protein NSK_007153 [Nannochloropsis salina CCMP1776]
MLCCLATKAGAMAWRRGAQSGRGTGSEGGSDTTIKIVTVTVAVLGLVSAVAGSTAVAVHHLDQTEIKRIHEKAKADVARDQTEIKRIHDKAETEIKRIHDKAATEIAQAKADVARDQTEIKRIQDKAAMEIAQAKADVARVEGERKSEVARVEGERRLSEERLRAEVERYKYDLRLSQTQDFEPYQAAIRENPIKRGGAGGPQD